MCNFTIRKNHRVMTIEVCCGHVEAACIAAKAGADRIELCSALALGGITPTPRHIELVKQSIDIPVMVLVRPREGHFSYTSKEKELYLAEIKSTLEAGAHGIVIGALTDEGNLDLDFLSAAQSLIDNQTICLHRCFDFLENPLDDVTKLISIGFDRILTSGMKTTALEGKQFIKDLIETVDDKIEILAGGGITKDNIQSLVNHTGLNQVHLSAKSKEKTPRRSGPFDTSLYTPSESDIKTIKSYYA